MTYTLFDLYMGKYSSIKRIIRIKTMIMMVITITKTTKMMITKTKMLLNK